MMSDRLVLERYLPVSPAGNRGSKDVGEITESIADWKMSGDAHYKLKDLLILNREYIPTFFYDLALKYVPTDLLESDFTKLLRIVIIVAGYLLFRKIILKHQISRAQTQEVDKTEDGVDNVDELFSKDEDATGTSTSIQESEWGWGQKSRKDIKKKQEILQQLINEAGKDEDDDIKDLLED